MSEITIETPENNEGVLGEAAITAATLSGAAAAEAATASERATEADEKAEAAIDLSAHAVETAEHKPSHHEVREMVTSEIREAMTALVAELRGALAPREHETETTVVEEIPAEVMPRSVEQAEKKTKKSFRDRYLGLGD